MTRALAHRGPDSSDVVVDGAIGLGSTRLSILDPTPAGAQPMTRDGNVLVHNGEIYNYLELGDELRSLGVRLTTESDSEVILAAYRMWGEDAVRRFNGMFAFALWDGARQRLVLARDRMGVKPMYTWRTARSLAFASEPPALIAGRPIDGSDTRPIEPDLGVMRDFLLGGWTDHTDRTFFDGIRSVPAAHLLIVDADGERLVRYWGPPDLADDDRPAVGRADLAGDRRLVNEFEALFESSVRLRLRSDVPIGTCLSGGLDSSAIVGTMARIAASGEAAGHQQLPQLAFHVRYPCEDVDEGPFAEMVARASGVRLVTRSPSGESLLAALLPVLRAQGEPFTGASIVAQHVVMAAARDEGLKVVLDGQGADELLGGYHQFFGVRTVGLLRSGQPMAATDELRAQVRRGVLTATGSLMWLVRSALPAAVLGKVQRAFPDRLGVRRGPTLERLERLPAEEVGPGTMLARRLWESISSTSLPAQLRYEDRASMAFGVEARVPFLDYRIVEFAARLPDRLRVGGGTSKVILRRAMKGTVPAEVIDRRDKLGFVAPQQTWLRSGIATLTELLDDGLVVERGWVRRDEVDRLLEDGLVARRAGDRLWRLVVAECWLRTWWPTEHSQASRVLQDALGGPGSDAVASG
jgi:asparagine synthase (glutamine-hydrolysing)